MLAVHPGGPECRSPAPIEHLNVAAHASNFPAGEEDERQEDLQDLLTLCLAKEQTPDSVGDTVSGEQGSGG